MVILVYISLQKISSLFPFCSVPTPFSISLIGWVVEYLIWLQILFAIVYSNWRAKNLTVYKNSVSHCNFLEKKLSRPVLWFKEIDRFCRITNIASKVTKIVMPLLGRNHLRWIFWIVKSLKLPLWVLSADADRTLCMNQIKITD